MLPLLVVVACTPTIVAQGVRPSDTDVDPAGRIPAAAFFRDPTFERPTLSPDGLHVAAVHSENGTHTLMVGATGGDVRAVTRFDQRGVVVREVGWASEEEIVASVEMESPDTVGVRARQTQLFVVGRGGEDPRFLEVRWLHQMQTQSRPLVLDWLWDDAETILVNFPGARATEGPEGETSSGRLMTSGRVEVSAQEVPLPGNRAVAPRKTSRMVQMSHLEPGSETSARLLDLSSGRLSTLVYPREHVQEWLSDHRGSVRAGQGRTRDGRYVLHARDRGLFIFEKLIEYQPFDEEGFEFAGFSPNPSVLYVWSDGETGRRSLYEYDLRARKMGPLIFHDRRYDAERVRFSRKDGRILAVEYADERPRLHFLDEAARREQLAIDRALPGTTNRIVSTNAEETLAIVRAESDVRPPEYYAFDRENKRMRMLFQAYPGIDPEKMSPMEPISFVARDGMEIHGYLTIPRGAERANLPAIVHPHSGPARRDVWGWDPTVQFLASRGFAVLQLNFRGSTGYGRAHTLAGFGHWGLAMQDDVSDGARWLLEQGIADPQRLGIFGQGFGGYVALRAAVNVPDLFQAVASVAGMTDLDQIANDHEWYEAAGWIEPPMTNRWADPSQLEELSPVHQAGRARAAVLIGHGVEDPVVHVRQAKAMSGALRRRGKTVETYLYENELHDFIDERNRIDFYEKLAAFFEKHLESEHSP